MRTVRTVAGEPAIDIPMDSVRPQRCYRRVGDFGLTGHLMYAEAFWWYLMLPVCLQRAFENAREDVLAEATHSQDERNRTGCLDLTVNTK